MTPEASPDRSNRTISPARWTQLEPIVDQALRLAPDEVPGFLDDRCQGDPELRGDIERLLRGGQEAASFLEEGAAAFAGPLLTAEETELMGQTIGPYQLLRQLGRGGMGEVYLAYDPRLDRQIALKLLPRWLAADQVACRRFTEEARAASALDHPNIETVYDVGEAADGRLYIALAYYEGETLKERIAKGPLPVAEAIHVASQLAAALAAAHARGIVHRDVKPSNVMLTADGAVKLVDFGVAKLVGRTVTEPGITPGTVAYMSPEQTRGEAVDTRTDVWSLGVVLYEVLIGTRPFRGASDRTLIHAIRHDEPRPPKELRPEIGARLERIVVRCLQKSPENRYPDAAALHEDLTAVRGGASVRRGPRRFAPLRVGLAAAAIAAIVTIVALLDSRPQPVEPALSASTIAVLPFTVSGADIEDWSEGMVTLLSTGLDGAGGLRAIDSRTVLAQWDRREQVGSSMGPEPALQVARRTGARYALTGSAVSIGPALRLTADVYQVDGALRLGQVRVEGSPEEVLELVDRLAIDVLRVLLGRDTDDVPRIELAGLTTSSLPALKAFLEGNRAYRRSDSRGAVTAYERAVAEDSTFALVYYQMVDAYGWVQRPGRSREALELAARFRNRLPARERLLVEAYLAGSKNGPEERLELILQATARYPDAAAAWYQLGEIYYHNPATLTSLDEAEEPFRRAAELDPAFGSYRVHLVHLAFQNHPDSSRVAEELGQYVTATSADARGLALAFALVFGDPETQAEARAALDTVDTGVLSSMMDFPLKHPRFYDAHRAVLEKLIDRPGWRLLPAGASHHVSSQLFQRGRLRAYLEDLDAGLITASTVRRCDLLLAHHMGVPVPDDRLESMLAIARTDTTTGSALWCGAMYAAERGRWSDHARASKLFRNEAQRVGQEDPTRARAMEVAVETLEAYANWRRGDGPAALRRLEEVRLAAQYFYFNVNLLFLTGELLLELGQPREAAQYFRAVREPRPDKISNPLAAYHMGRAYEELGAVEEAREAYASFVSYWKDADPELQPLVESARQAVLRLSRTAE